MIPRCVFWYRYEGATHQPVYTEVRTHAPWGVYRGVRNPPGDLVRWPPVTFSPPEWPQESSFGFASHGDDDFSSGVSLFQITDGLGDLAQRVRSVDDRCDLSGFKKLFQNNQILLVWFLRQVAHFLVPGH